MTETVSIVSLPCVPCLGSPRVHNSVLLYTYTYYIIYNFSSRYAITIQYVLHGATHTDIRTV